MLAHADLQRSIRAMTLSFARQVRKRDAEPLLYGLGEWEQQFQYEVSGTVGVLPPEVTLDLDFGVMFLGDSGNQRDSTLDRPHLRTGWEVEIGPPGLMPYAQVRGWKRDADFNFVGAEVLVGAHAPAVALGVPLDPINFLIAVHLSFQGWGAVNDADGPFDGGGDITIDSGAT